jgi:uncharacterized protein (TIGR03437 family)
MRFDPSLSRTAVLALIAPVLFAQSQTITYSYNGLPLPIFVDDADVVTIADVFVPIALNVQSVRVTVDIDYPRPEDLNVFVYSAANTRTKLVERNCGSSGSLRNITFDDFAGSRYSDVCPSASGGTFRGNEPLANSQGQVSFGVWKLAVENNGSNDFLGRIVGFRVSITGTPFALKPVTSSDAIVSASSFQPGSFAPGDLLDVFGAGLGPVGGIQAPAGNLPTTLGGTQATIGGYPVAIRFASGVALQVQIPYIVPGGDHPFVITYNGLSSDPVTVNVVSTNPGIFTTSPLGTGDAKAANQNGSLNTSSNRAAKGSVVAIYATGLGTITPNLATGQSPPADPLSVTNFPVSAVVGGVGAPVQFAGPAPGFPGTYQVNVQIPDSVGSGYQYVTLWADGVPTQSSVGIWIN